MTQGQIDLGRNDSGPKRHLTMPVMDFGTPRSTIDQPHSRCNYMWTKRSTRLLFIFQEMLKPLHVLRPILGDSLLVGSEF